MDETRQQAVWARHAAQWEKLGSPLKPCHEDGELMHAAVASVLQGIESPVVGILGVTPEIVQGPWPHGTRLQAFDQSHEIIVSVWKPNKAICSSHACQAQWQNLPLPDGSLDVVAGDNALGALYGLAECAQVLAEVARVLKPGGLLCLRYLMLPGALSTPAQLREAALAGRIRSFHALKWRLAMTMSAPPEYSVATADILATFNRLFPDRRVLAHASQWHRRVVDTIDAYRGATTRYCIAPMAQLEVVLDPWFEITGRDYGHYELADCCPTLTFKRRTGE